MKRYELTTKQFTKIQNHSLIQACCDWEEAGKTKIVITTSHPNAKGFLEYLGYTAMA